MITRRQFGLLAGGAALSALAPPSVAATSARGSRPKRGCCVVTGKDSDAWRARVDALDPAWLYNWGRNRPDGLPESVDYVPMIWGNLSEQKAAESLADLKARIDTGDVNHLLGFNEPDQPRQSNITVDRAVELWPMLMELGAPLVSPGCVHPDREWMHGFMEQVEKRGLRVDAVAVHSYGGPSAEHLVQRLENVHREFGRPLWVTEFAVGDWQAKSAEENRHSPERIAKFLHEVLPALDSLLFVERYAWFSAQPSAAALGTSALFDVNGRLTPLGEIYRDA